jgi:hypothetical protein
LKYISFIIFTLLLLSGCSSNGYTNHIYLIPEGYEGSFTVFFNVPDAPELDTEDEFAVIPIETTEIKELHQTDYSTYGYAMTSREETYLPKAQTYEINNKYYYVDKEGNRSKIDDSCIYEDGHGGTTYSSGKEVGYIDIQVTHSECGEDFHMNGKEWYKIQNKEAKNNLLDKLE